MSFPTNETSETNSWNFHNTQRQNVMQNRRHHNRKDTKRSPPLEWTATFFDKICRNSTLFDIIWQNPTKFDIIRQNATKFIIIRQHSAKIRQNVTKFDNFRPDSTLFGTMRLQSPRIAVHPGGWGGGRTYTIIVITAYLKKAFWKTANVDSFEIIPFSF